MQETDPREMRQEMRHQVDGAKVAEKERSHDAAHADERTRDRVAKEELQVRLQAGEEQQDDRRDRADAV